MNQLLYSYNPFEYSLPLPRATSGNLESPFLSFLLFRIPFGMWCHVRNLCFIMSYLIQLPRYQELFKVDEYDMVTANSLYTAECRQLEKQTAMLLLCLCANKGHADRKRKQNNKKMNSSIFCFSFHCPVTS